MKIDGKWHWWDGSTDWWMKTREAELRPRGNWARFRDACLERLRATPHVVIRARSEGFTQVYFCPNAWQARNLRRCPVKKLPIYDPPHVGLMELIQSLSIEFEYSSDSPARMKFVRWCHRSLGRLLICLHP